MLHIYISRHRAFPAPRTFGYRLSVGIDDGAATRIFTGRINSHAVHSGYITLIFNSPRTKQRAPGIHTGGRPACHIKYHVIITQVTCPNREAKVITYFQQDTYPTEVHHHTLRTGGETLVFAPKGKQMLLIIMLHSSSGWTK